MLASIVFGVADFFGGMSARRIAPLATAVVVQIVGILVLVVGGLPLLGGEPLVGDLVIGALAGLVGGSALGVFYFALARGAMSVVAPLSAVTSATVPVVAGLLIGELPATADWIGIALALPAVLLISREGTSEPSRQAEEPLEERAGPEDNRLGILAGLAAGVGFGLFVVLITRTSSTSGVWPLLSSRGASTLLLGTVALATGTLVGLGGAADPASPARRGLVLALLAGAMDGTSNMLIVEAGRRGMLFLVGVIGAMYPASTILLARVVLGERLQRQQWLGLGLALVAVALIAA